MNFTLTKNKDFMESFDFKNAQGKAIVLPPGNLRVVLERGGFVREYVVGKGLTRQRNSLIWTIRKQESQDFDFSTMYYTLYLNDIEITRGVLKIRQEESTWLT